MLIGVAMCGVAGIVDREGPIDEQDLRTMMGLMAHRGPDDHGILLDAPVGLGFVRLSVIDLSPEANQPMASHDGRLVVVYNGEIFNYVELREELEGLGHHFATQTDTEVLIAAYAEWGEAMLHRLNGMWSFLLLDRERRVLLAVRDRYGIKPLYFGEQGGRLFLASEIPPILALRSTKPTANLDAVFDYLVYNRTDHSDATFFNEIRKVSAGGLLEVALDSGEVAERRWYDLRRELKEPFGDPAEYRETLTSAVKLRLRSDVPVGVCLSGGLDSSAILSTIVRTLDWGDVNTFSSVYGDGVQGDETRFIREYESEVPNMHFTRPDEHTMLADLDRFFEVHFEPVPSASVYAQYKVMELAKDFVTVTLDGQGADEQLAGHHYFFGFWFRELLGRARLARLASEIVAARRCGAQRAGLRSLGMTLLPASLRRRMRVASTSYLASDFAQTAGDGGDTIATELYGARSLTDSLVRHFEYKLEHLLKYEDRNSMSFSLEARVPFLDHRLVERTLSLGSEEIISAGTTKVILRRSMEGLLPERIRTRRDKMGFETPEASWFRTPGFAAVFSDVVSSSSIASRGIVDPRKVEALYSAHLAGSGNFAREIWKVLHLERWFTAYID